MKTMTLAIAVTTLFAISAAAIGARQAQAEALLILVTPLPAAPEQRPSERVELRGFGSFIVKKREARRRAQSRRINRLKLRSANRRFTSGRRSR